MTAKALEQRLKNFATVSRAALSIAASQRNNLAPRVTKDQLTKPNESERTFQFSICPFSAQKREKY